jgi:simple sugar transport system substrate-binding protein
MTRFAIAVLLAVLALAGAACGETEVVREGAVVVASAPRDSPTGEQAAPDAAVQIAVVTHGEASSKFWAVVRNGVEAAAREQDALVSYRAPEVYSLERMSTMIRQAVESEPDGLVVSFPEPGLAPAIRRAVRAGVPVVTINSGSEESLALGTVAHVGQPEERSGLLAGRRLVRAGARRALCINQQVGNTGLDARCRGLSRALRRAGGTSLVLGVDDMDPATPSRIANAVSSGRIDGILAMNSLTALQSADGVRAAGRAGEVTIGAFDLVPEVLEAIIARRVAFTVDQQPYLQGYWPIAMLAQRARFGLMPSQGEVVPTGPNFVTPANAARALELSRRSIR